MSTPRPGPGRTRRPSPAVYRRRRIVAGTALLLVLALLVWGAAAIVGAFAGPGAGAGAAAPPSSSATPGPEGPAASASGETPPSGSPSPSASPSASADPSADAGAPRCSDADLEITASTDRASYGEGQEPVLEMGIENTSGSPCTVDVGTGAQEFVVVSGSDRIFSSKDCLADPTTVDLVLRPGEPETARFTWQRHRSAEGCADVSAEPRPGTYAFTARLGGAESERAAFTLH